MGPRKSPRALVVLPPGTGDVAAGDALGVETPGLATSMVRPKYLESSSNGTSDVFSSVISAMKWLERRRSCAEPPGRESREHFAFAWDARREDDVERGDAVGSHDQEVFAKVEDVTNLAAGKPIGKVGFEKDFRHRFPPWGVLGCFFTRGHAEARDHFTDMPLRSREADAERPGYLHVRATGSYEPQYLPLPRRQPAGRVVFGLSSRSHAENVSAFTWAVPSLSGQFQYVMSAGLRRGGWAIAPPPLRKATSRVGMRHGSPLVSPVCRSVASEWLTTARDGGDQQETNDKGDVRFPDARRLGRSRWQEAAQRDGDQSSGWGSSASPGSSPRDTQVSPGRRLNRRPVVV